jgi:uncharacterized protein YybS (DUF2232 family)
MAEVVLWGLLSLLLFLATSFVPLFGFLFTPFTPLPLILLFLRRGIKGWAAGLLLLFLILVLSSSISSGIAFALEFGAIALALGEGIRREWKGEETILLGTVVAGSGSALVLYLHTLRSPMDLSAWIGEQIGNRLQEMGEIFARAGVPPASWDSLQRFLMETYPALLVMGILFATVINYYSAAYFRGFGNPEAVPRIRPFSSWSLPDYWVWGLILSLSLYLIPGPTKGVGLNFLLVFSGLYLLQGMAISSYLLRRWHLSTVLRIVIFFLLIAQPFLVLMLVGLGLLDVWLNLRKIGDPLRTTGG